LWLLGLWWPAALPAQTASQPAAPRIISLYAADTEILLRLGARDNLAGVSRQETYDGPETRDWVRPPAFSAHDDVEKFLAAAPDVILARPMHLSAAPALFETLRNSGIQVWAKQCLRAQDLFAFWEELGGLAGRTKEAQALTAEFRAALKPFEALQSDARPGVFFEAVHREVKTFAPDSIPIWLLELAGGRNAAADARPVRAGLIVADYGLERLLEKADDVEIFVAQQGPMNNVRVETLKDRTAYQVLKAFKNDRVYTIPEELVSRPVPSLLEGLTLLREMIAGPEKR
jgi:iron complex transport system substrate-binding protein